MTDEAAAPRLVVVCSGARAEEKSIIAHAERLGAVVTCAVDADLLVGDETQIPRSARVVIRSASYFRGCLIASWLQHRGHWLLNRFDWLSLFGVKSRTDDWLRSHGLPAIPSRICLGGDSVESICEQLAFPLIVKPDIGGFGRRVHLLRDPLELRQACENIFELAPSHLRYAYVQQYCEAELDLRVIVLDGAVLAVMDRRKSDGPSVARNIARGGEGVAHTPGPAEAAVIDRLARVMPPGFYGADLLVSRDGEVHICEINAVCRFAEITRVTGVDIAAAVAAAALGQPRAVEVACA